MEEAGAASTDRYSQSRAEAVASLLYCVKGGYARKLQTQGVWLCFI